MVYANQFIWGRGKRFSGLTLIELTAVVAIIGILAALSVGPIRAAQQRSRDTQRKADLNLIAQGLDLYMAAHRALPDPGTTTNSLCSSWLGTTNDTWTSSVDGSASQGWIPGLRDYLPSTKSKQFPVPVDPRHPQVDHPYCYKPSTQPGQSYVLFAVLENCNDSEASLVERSGSPCKTGKDRVYKIIR